MNLGPWEILIIAVVVVLLFGARKMPAMARSLGQSMRILKAETKGMRADDEDDKADRPAAPAQQAAALPAAKPEQSPEQLRSEIDELQRKLNQQQAQKNAG
ncbi:Sec-independent protein translocase subunit TatA [Actinokineospora cianjurensis]|uniref:Sec-independent protein translocase protein TatA n=1 Tax=Actinokineospora cianjurensis TaxID=585224 RepID=A0A421B417_9PSEU|nr:Sec-independent protein translocase subunit TatA [Actinokineospora cianjurensis]RLK59104.1 sec-independent protein translocase protein TatA [Actinokineospora cianjurensis]